MQVCTIFGNELVYICTKPTIMTEKFSIKCGDIQKADSIEDLKEKVANLPEGTEVLIYYATIEQAD